MRTKSESWEDPLFTGRPCSESSREDKSPRPDGLQASGSRVSPPIGEAPEPSEQPGRWQSIIGKIVAFSPEPNNHGVRYCGAVLNVSEAPDYAGLPTCLATVRGRSGKTVVIDFTKCYAQIHQTWKEAEQ